MCPASERQATAMWCIGRLGLQVRRLSRPLASSRFRNVGGNTAIPKALPVRLAIMGRLVQV
jgi:hypothetical protein